MECKKLIHQMWEDWQCIRKDDRLKSIIGKDGWVGKYQYIYSSEKGEISLVKIKVGITNKADWMWEIYELSNNKLFEDVERFLTKKEAVKRIREVLG